MVAPNSMEQFFDRDQVKQFKRFRPLDCVLELTWSQNRRKVEKRAGKRRDRDPLTDGAILRDQYLRMMQANGGSRTPANGAGDIDTAWFRKDAPEPASRTVAEQGAGPAGKHGGQVATMDAQARMPHRIDIAVEAVKTSGIRCSSDRALRVAEPAAELSAGDHAVLSLGQFSDRKIAFRPRITTRSTLSPHSGSKVDRTGESPPLGGVGGYLLDLAFDLPAGIQISAMTEAAARTIAARIRSCWSLGTETSPVFLLIWSPALMPDVFWLGFGISAFCVLVGLIAGARSSTTGAMTGLAIGAFLGLMAGFPLLALGLATS